MEKILIALVSLFSINSAIANQCPELEEGLYQSKTSSFNQIKITKGQQNDSYIITRLTNGKIENETTILGFDRSSNDKFEVMYWDGKKRIDYDGAYCEEGKLYTFDSVSVEEISETEDLEQLLDSMRNRDFSLQRRNSSLHRSHIEIIGESLVEILIYRFSSSNQSGELRNFYKKIE